MRERHVGGKESTRIYLEGDVREKGMGSKEKLTTYCFDMFGGRRDGRDEWEDVWKEKGGRGKGGWRIWLEVVGNRSKAELEDMVTVRKINESINIYNTVH